MVKNLVNVFCIDDVSDEELNKLDFDAETLKQYNRKVLNKKGSIKIDNVVFTPPKQYIKSLYKYEYTKYELSTLQMFKSSEKNAEDMLDSCKRKRERYEKILLDNALEELGIDNEEVVYSLRDCDLSIIGKCIFYNKQCLFCNRKED